MKNLIWILALLMMTGCAEDNTTEPIDNISIDEADIVSTDEDAEGGETALVDGGNSDATSEDDPTDTSSEDAVNDEDAGTGEDSDALPLAKVYKNNPLDNGTITVEIPHITDPDGYLTGKYVKVWNCTREDGGEVVDFGFGSMTLCNQKQTVTPEDGNYLHITPSTSDDGSDSFAELNMYYHVNLIHDYFANVHGMKDLDFPLTAIVNVQANIDLLGGWFPFDNAAFIPEESFSAFPLPLQVGDGGAIIFGQGAKVDYAYEVDVIYHEYTHAMVGTTRLTGFVKDEYGPDNTPGAMNEGFADYFATTLTGDPVMGEYALADVSGLMSDGPGQDLRRDLSKFHACPANITTEIHADGLIIGNALWTMREEYGAELADTIILNALGTFTENTNFTFAAEAIITEAELVDEDTGKRVREIFEERGLIGCDRVMDYTGTVLISGGGAIPFTIPGTQETDIIPFSSYTPSFQQWRTALSSDMQSLKVEMQGQAGGGGFGGFGGATEDPIIELAVKWGDEPILYTYDGTKPAEHDADLILPMDSSEGTQGLVKYIVEIPIPCEASPESVVVQFHTRSTSGVAGIILDIDQSSTPLEGVEACGATTEEGTEMAEEGSESDEQEGTEATEEEDETNDEEGGTL